MERSILAWAWMYRTSITTLVSAARKRIQRSFASILNAPLFKMRSTAAIAIRQMVDLTVLICTESMPASDRVLVQIPMNPQIEAQAITDAAESVLADTGVLSSYSTNTCPLGEQVVLNMALSFTCQRCKDEGIRLQLP